MNEDSQLSLANTTSKVIPEVTPPVTYLDDHRRKIEVYSFLKSRSVAMARYIHGAIESMPGPQERARWLKVYDKMNQCRNLLVYNDYFADEKVRQERVRSSCSQTMLCPLCATSKAIKRQEAYFRKATEIKRQHPKLKAYFITFTLKNGPDLRRQFDLLTAAMTILKNTPKDAKRGRKSAMESQFASVIGGVTSIEVKRGSGSGLWHPHCHCIILSTAEINQEKLSDEWKIITELLGNESHKVHVKEFDITDKKSFLEILKYPVKCTDMNFEDNLQAAIILRGVHLLRPFGKFIGIKEDVNCDLDDTRQLDAPFIRRSYRYIGRTGKYTLDNSDGSVVLPMKRIFHPCLIEDHELPY